MSGSEKIGDTGLRKPGIYFAQEGSPLPVQASSAYLAQSQIASAASGDNFRQGWQAILDALSSASISSGDSASEVKSLSASRQSVSPGSAVLQGAGGIPEIKEIAARAPGRSFSEFSRSAPGSSIAQDTQSRRPFMRAVDSNELSSHGVSTKGKTDRATRHLLSSANRGETSLGKNLASGAGVAKLADSQLVTYPVSSPLSPPQICAKGLQQSKLPAILPTDPPENAGRHPFDMEASEVRDVAVPTANGPQGHTAQPGDRNESTTEAKSVSSPSLSEETTAEREARSVLDAAALHASGSAQSHPATEEKQSLRPSSSDFSDMAAPPSGAVQPRATTDFVLSAADDSKPEIIKTFKTDAPQRAHAEFAEARFLPSAKARAANITHPTGADADAVSVEATHAEILPSTQFPAAVPPSPSSQQVNAHVVPGGQTPSAHEPFTALDSAMSDGSAKWTLAGNHKAEAGFQDPALGWISVRAQSASGAIHADVVAPNEAAAHVLTGHLAGLNAHMASHYEHMGTVTLSTSDFVRNSHQQPGEMSQRNAPDYGGGGQPHGQENSQSGSLARPLSQPATTLSKERVTVTEFETVNASLHTFTHRISVVV